MQLRFKLDENLPADSALALAQAGHDVETAVQEGLGGASDADVLKASRAESRVLVTLDLDFSDIRTYPPSEHFGIWILRPERQSVRQTVQLLESALRMLAIETPVRRLWIVEQRRIRIRE